MDTAKPGTWAALTRSTESEHQAFMKALKGLTFSAEEFCKHGPMIILQKYDECLRKLEK